MSFKHLVFWCFCACLIGCSDSPNSGVVRFYLGDTTFVSLKTSLPAEGEDLIVYNASERVVLNNVDNDVFSVPIYGGSLVGKWNSDGAFCGTWIDSLRPNNYSVALEITHVVSEPPCNEERVKTVYETSLGLLVTEVFCDSVVGTFLTPTGDYRYLSGTISNKSLVLNTFDGAHLFYFSATISGDSLTNGVFKSGLHYGVSWAGVKTDNLVPGWSSHQPYNKDRVFEFKATALNGKDLIINRTWLEGRGKSLLVMDVFGTWCPNCYDEINLLKELKTKYPQVEFLSLAFERGDKKQALKRIQYFKNEQEISWDILYGGVSKKQLADSVVPFLGGVNSFPTTLFYPLDGDPVVHTGFNGPATPFYSNEVDFYDGVIKQFIE